jgi:N-methylhydantoinase A
MRLERQRLEAVNWRVEGHAPAPVAPERAATADGARPAASRRSRKAWFPDVAAFVDTPVLAEADLRPGERHDGPALVEQAGSTVVVGPGDRFGLDDHGHLRVTVGGAR